MSLSQQTARVAGAGKNTLKILLQKFGVTVGDELISQYPDLASGISNKLLPDNLLAASVAALYGKDGSAVPSDIFQILSKAALYENGIIKDILGGNPVTPGDCKFYCTSYIGIGNISLPSTFSVTFPLFPEIIFTYDPTLENASKKDNLMMTIPKANTVLSVANGRFGRDTTTVEYSGNTVSWTTNVTMNWSGKTYNVIAVLKT